MPWIVAALVAASLTVAVVFTNRDDVPARLPANVPAEAVLPADTNQSKPSPAVHPVSIPGLAEYQPTGRDLRIGRVLDDNSAYARHYVTYRSDELTISGILNIPKGDGPFPVLFLNHGYIDPAVYTNGRGLRREQDYFSRRGYAVLHSDYRCHADSDCPSDDPLAQRLFYAKDVINAVEAVRASGDPRLSAERFGMLGHSMGGGVAQTIMVAKPDLVRAVVLYAPVSSDYRDSFERYTQRRPDDVNVITEMYGQPDENVDFWDNLGPRYFFDRITVPVEIYQGTADADVPKSWSDETAARLEAAGKDVTYHVFDGQPHEFTSSWTTFMQRSTAFFDRFVKN